MNGEIVFEVHFKREFFFLDCVKAEMFWIKMLQNILKSPPLLS